MCLAIPAKIIEINKDNSAKVDYGGVKKQIRLDLVDVKVNDYVLIHAGFAIEKMDKKTALKTIKDINKLILND
ncbi:MAG: HypC/HybG/HupF family hydrogenase formation chaperone [Candidatus Woesearchaeota archaeon]